jgi:trimethylguanosine synthase
MMEEEKDDNNNKDQIIEATTIGLPAPDTKTRKRKRSHDNCKSKKKPNKKSKKFWIEDCPDTIMTMGADLGVVPTLEILITRSTLTDAYLQAPCWKVTSPPKVEDATLPHEKDDEGIDRAETGSQSSTSGNLTSSYVVRRDVQDHQTLPSKSVTNNTDQGAAGKTHVVPTGGEPSQPEASDVFEHAIIYIKRGNSAKKPMQSNTPTVEHFRPLPNGDCGDGILNPFPKNEVEDKYWSQRRRLFTRFDLGIQLDRESWFSVTPEAIANHIAAHLVGTRKNIIVLDPFCGCGGNSIAFARRMEVDLVVGVDTDLSKLKRAASNAAIYEIPPEKMVFVHANGNHVMSCYKDRILTFDGQDHGNKNGASMTMEGFKIGGINHLPQNVDCIFLSPPWGGVDYGEVGKRNYSLQCIKVQSMDEKKEYDNGEEILKYAADCLGRNGPIAYFLPKNTDGRRFGRSVLKVGYGGPVVMEQNVLNGKLKTITAYIGL